MSDSRYWIMDGRANLDIDRALVLETCDTLEEAREALDLYADDSVIVDVETQEIVY